MRRVCVAVVAHQHPCLRAWPAGHHFIGGVDVGLGIVQRDKSGFLFVDPLCVRGDFHCKDVKKLALTAAVAEVRALVCVMMQPV